MELREYKDFDKDQLLRLLDSFQDYLIDIDPLKRIKRLPGFAENYLKGMLERVSKMQGRIIVGTKGSKLIGFVEGVIKSQTKSDLLSYEQIITGEIDELFVDSEYREHGLGSELLKSMENYLKENNCKSCVLSIFKPNTMALEFYKNKEYKERTVFLLKDLN